MIISQCLQFEIPMKRCSFIKHAFNFLLLYFLSTPVYAVDVYITKAAGIYDKKSEHKEEVLKRALEITEREFGPFKIEKYHQENDFGRKLKALYERGLVNTTMMPANELWDDYCIPIKVPVRLGLLSYRVLLINEDDLPTFAKINRLEELSLLTAGVISGWATTKAFKYNNMKLVGTSHFDGLFYMLPKKRFDYIPRGVNEVYDELHTRQGTLEGVVIEPSIALYIPTSTNFYIAKSEPKLAKRLEKGLKIMIESGELKDILYKYFAKDIQRANLDNRKLFKVENPYHTKNNKADEKYYLFTH